MFYSQFVFWYVKWLIDIWFLPDLLISPWYGFFLMLEVCKSIGIFHKEKNELHV